MVFLVQKVLTEMVKEWKDPEKGLFIYFFIFFLFFFFFFSRSQRKFIFEEKVCVFVPNKRPKIDAAFKSQGVLILAFEG